MCTAGGLLIAALAMLANPSAAFGQCAPDCSPRKQNIECLNPSPQYDNRTFVGQLLTPAGLCTAWIVASDGTDSIVMTNEHCTVGLNVTNMTVRFNFQCSACTGGAPEATQTFPVTALITQNAALDYALLRVSGDPAATFGIATIDSSTPAVGQAIYEIHHAGGLVKGYDAGTVLNLNVAACVANEISLSSLVASGGASGSPIFRFDNHCVTAICNCGDLCQDGFGVPMSNIIPNAQPILQAAGFDFTDCFPPPTGACCLPDGDCFVDTQPECDDEGGIYQGDGTDCDSNPCPTGACCVPDGDCFVDIQPECDHEGGIYQGDFTDCDSNPCPTGACCLYPSGCRLVSEADCLDLGGSFFPDTTCEFGPYGPACPYPPGVAALFGEQRPASALAALLTVVVLMGFQLAMCKRR